MNASIRAVIYRWRTGAGNFRLNGKLVGKFARKERLTFEGQARVGSCRDLGFSKGGKEAALSLLATGRRITSFSAFGSFNPSIVLCRSARSSFSELN